MPVTVGRLTYVNWSAGFLALWPPGVVTTISTAPAVPAGEVAVMEVSEFTAKGKAPASPKATNVTPMKALPVMVTDVPPAVGPATGLMPVTAGLSPYVNWSAGLGRLVPAGPVTLTSTTPVAPAGDVAVMEVSELTVKVAAALPKFTAAAPVKLAPVMVTGVAPVVGPPSG